LKQLKSGHSQDPAVELAELVKKLKNDENSTLLRLSDTDLELTLKILKQYNLGREGIEDEVKVILESLLKSE
jgi:hypothetical protein